MAKPKALLFDMFGTVVDWLNTVAPYLEKQATKRAKGSPTLTDRVSEIEWIKFTKQWRKGYFERTSEIMKAGSGFEDVDEIHLNLLKELVQEHGIEHLWTEIELKQVNNIWHQLNGWPDSSNALKELKESFIIAVLTNVVDVAKHSDLPWDMIFTGDLFKTYKPHKSIYLGACKYLQLQPEEVMMVAAHKYDVVAAKELGFQTAYIRRTTEDIGLKVEQNLFDFYADDLESLSAQLKREPV